jgi:hypothetical protein
LKLSSFLTAHDKARRANAPGFVIKREEKGMKRKRLGCKKADERKRHSPFSTAKS